jgi:ribulose kinase
MACRFPRCELVDWVWLAAADGRWRSQCDLFHKTRFKEEEIAAALRFLVKYGFAESSPAEVERFKMVTYGPSPFEAANLLRAVAYESG